MPTPKDGAHVLYSSLPDEWDQKVMSYVNENWNEKNRLDSLYPIMLKLEQAFGPGWRLDNVIDYKVEDPEAVPQSTINFCFGKDPTIYSIWRQRVPDNPISL
ncbi:hypothetical protein FBUS_02866 [Fasciolopsis buskii]|uniref:Uncharacterized protein n=1 Tax=Fasciolopsis buskii TaxID=27845 RepID=A0A8E0VIP3_9TREM|nr:hypothetical protein FBUS_02866 [Fasciolopsis buski]